MWPRETHGHRGVPQVGVPNRSWTRQRARGMDAGRQHRSVLRRPPISSPDRQLEVQRRIFGHCPGAPSSGSRSMPTRQVVEANYMHRSGGGGRESNPPGSFRPHYGFEDRGAHQAPFRLRIEHRRGRAPGPKTGGSLPPYVSPTGSSRCSRRYPVEADRVRAGVHQVRVEAHVSRRRSLARPHADPLSARGKRLRVLRRTLTLSLPQGHRTFVGFFEMDRFAFATLIRGT